MIFPSSEKYSVIGLGFGDEGKGFTTDYLASKFSYPVVVRHSGGHQAGHNVAVDGKQHIFSQFGSGTLRGARTYWTKNCTIEPIALRNEYIELGKKGIKPTVYYDRNCPITTPMDRWMNLTNEAMNNHGSVGFGFGATIEREENFYSLTAIDLVYPIIFMEKLKQIVSYYGYSSVHDISSNKEFKSFLDACEWFREEFIGNVGFIVDDTFTLESDTFIYEGSQGLMLDPHIGFFPNVTRSKIACSDLVESTYTVCVTRAYATRHGNGFLPNEYSVPNFEINNFNETNVYNAPQGNFRKTILDIDVLEYAIEKSGLYKNIEDRILMVTCLDHISSNYWYMEDGKVKRFSNSHDFLKSLNDRLGFGRVLFSESSDSKYVMELL